MYIYVEIYVAAMGEAAEVYAVALAEAEGLAL